MRSRRFRLQPRVPLHPPCMGRSAVVLLARSACPLEPAVYLGTECCQPVIYIYYVLLTSRHLHCPQPRTKSTSLPSANFFFSHTSVTSEPRHHQLSLSLQEGPEPARPCFPRQPFAWYARLFAFSESDIMLCWSSLIIFTLLPPARPCLLSASSCSSRPLPENCFH